MYINYMVPEDIHIIGLEENHNKIKGIAEFSFDDKEKPEIQLILDDVVPIKKKEHKTIVKNARRGKHAKPGNELF